MEPKRLYKSRTNRVLCGVCGGIGEYFGIDPTIVRLLCVLLGCTSTGLILYIIAAIIMPEEYWLKFGSKDFLPQTSCPYE